ncbi:SdpI family protein [Kangiella sp. TOML190]|uniref:SdpI family protein n=1 Tax=Kangiella sp. TOML190 TaxID=2931351 RepID=UPI00203C1CD7|nr:SdpI family protein [Kangiella sp. TOML190]
MIFYFVGLFAVGLVFYYLSGKMANPDFKPNALSGIRTPETLADKEIWRLVNTKAAVYFRQFSYGIFALAFMSLAFARGILALLIFIGFVVLVCLLLWRHGQLKEYAKQLYAQKYPKKITQEDEED